MHVRPSPRRSTDRQTTALFSANAHLDAVILKALALEHINVAKHHSLYNFPLLAPKGLGDRHVDALCGVNRDPLVLIIRVRGDTLTLIMLSAISFKLPVLNFDHAAM